MGLRHCHFETMLSGPPPEVSWVEALTENYLCWEDGRTRRPLSTLEKIRKKLPVALHGVSLSIGAAEALDLSYLKRLKDLADQIEPCWISDHLCWTGIDRHNLHDLLPLPYTAETVHWIGEKIDRVQNALNRRILLENVSSYAEFSDSEMTEWEFIREIALRSGCGILLDINNVYVSSYNHGFDPKEYLRAMPWDHVGQIHLAGHSNRGTYLVDTHDHPVCDAVWDLYRGIVAQAPAVSTMIEWDDQIPEWPVLANEVVKARTLWETECKKNELPPGNATQFAATV